MNDTNTGVVGATTESERMWAASAHLLGLVLAFLTAWAAGAAGMLGALVVLLAKRDDSPFAAEHAREALNFNLSMFLYACAAVVTGFLLVGATVLTLGLGLLVTGPAGVLLLLACGAVFMTWLVCSVIATIKAFNGERYRYPLTLRLIR